MRIVKGISQSCLQEDFSGTSMPRTPCRKCANHAPTMYLGGSFVTPNVGGQANIAGHLNINLGVTVARRVACARERMRYAVCGSAATTIMKPASKQIPMSMSQKSRQVEGDATTSKKSRVQSGDDFDVTCHNLNHKRRPSRLFNLRLIT